MNRFVGNGALSIAVLLIVSALPAFPSTFLSFNIGSGTGSWSTSGGVDTGSFTISQVVETDPSLGYSHTFNLIAGDFLTLSFNTGTPSLSITNPGTAGSPFTNVGALALYSATTSLAYSGTISASTLSETVSGNATGLNSAFLSDLSLAPGTVFAISGGIIGSSGTISSDSIVFTTNADVVTLPEPRAIFMLGSGLLALALMSLKRRSVI